MPVASRGTTHDRVYNAQVADVSTPSITYIPIAKSGRLVDGWIAISAAVTVANSVITAKKGTATLGTITVPFTGSAIGATAQLVISGTEADCTFQAGDTLILDNDGGATTTSLGNVSIVVRGL